MMLKAALDALALEQKQYFNEVADADLEGRPVIRGQYKQILRGQRAGYWVDVYDGPLGKGWIVREERLHLGVEEAMCTDMGPEGRSLRWARKIDGDYEETRT